MSGGLDYTAADLAVYPLGYDSDHGPALADALTAARMEGEDGLYVAALIARTCAVGYGGHFDETIDLEDEVLDALAEHLAPLYAMEVSRALELLEQIRREYALRLRAAHAEVLERWARAGFYLELERTDPDHCPACGGAIHDFDETGCEDSSGQRWCIGHAMNALGALQKLRRGR